jgi:hypothetical protein
MPALVLIIIALGLIATKEFNLLGQARHLQDAFYVPVAALLGLAWFIHANRDTIRTYAETGRAKRFIAKTFPFAFFWSFVCGGFAMIGYRKHLDTLFQHQVGHEEIDAFIAQWQTIALVATLVAFIIAMTYLFWYVAIVAIAKITESTRSADRLVPHARESQIPAPQEHPAAPAAAAFPTVSGQSHALYFGKGYQRFMLFTFLANALLLAWTGEQWLFEARNLRQVDSITVLSVAGTMVILGAFLIAMKRVPAIRLQPGQLILARGMRSLRIAASDILAYRKRANDIVIILNDGDNHTISTKLLDESAVLLTTTWLAESVPPVDHTQPTADKLLRAADQGRLPMGRERKKVIILMIIALVISVVVALYVLVKLTRTPQQIATDSLAIIAKASAAKDVEDASLAIIGSAAVGPLDLAPLVTWVERDMNEKERTRENYNADFGAVLQAITVFGQYDTSGSSLPVLARIKAFHPKDDIMTGYRYLQTYAQKAELEIKVRQLHDAVNKANAKLGLPSSNP